MNQCRRLRQSALAVAKAKVLETFLSAAQGCTVRYEYATLRGSVVCRKYAIMPLSGYPLPSRHMCF
jgi:hypothetical protein